MTYLFTDITTDRDSHDDQLRALSGPQDGPEVWVLRWQGVDSLQVLHLVLGGRHFRLKSNRSGEGRSRRDGE